MQQLFVMVVALGFVAVFAHRSEAAGTEEGVAVAGEPARADALGVEEAGLSPSAKLGLKALPKEIIIKKTVMNPRVCCASSKPRGPHNR
jgi:hypothetical protein